MQFYKCKRKKKYFLSYPFRIAPLHPRLPKFHNVQNAPGLTSSANKTAPTSFAPPTSQISQCSKCHMFAELTKRNVCKSFFTWKLFVQGFIRANLCGMCFFTIIGMVRSVIGMSFILWVRGIVGNWQSHEFFGGGPAMRAPRGRCQQKGHKRDPILGARKHGFVSVTWQFRSVTVPDLENELILNCLTFIWRSSIPKGTDCCLFANHSINNWFERSCKTHSAIPWHGQNPAEFFRKCPQEWGAHLRRLRTLPPPLRVLQEEAGLTQESNVRFHLALILVLFFGTSFGGHAKFPNTWQINKFAYTAPILRVEFLNHFEVHM